MIRTLTLVLWVFAGTAYAQMSDDPAMQDINRRSALCRDFDCYYQVCADTFAQADEMLIQTLRNDPATLKAQEHNLSRNRPSEVRRNCTDHANIDVWCHGNDECIQDGEVARDRAKREGRPMTEQDWRDAHCTRESIERGEDRETTRLRCGRP